MRESRREERTNVSVPAALVRHKPTRVRRKVKILQDGVAHAVEADHRCRIRNYTIVRRYRSNESTALVKSEAVAKTGIG